MMKLIAVSECLPLRRWYNGGVLRKKILTMSMKKEKKTVVGTCRAENHAWIAERRLYNLPLPKDGAGAGYASVTHVVVYARDLPALAFAAKYVRDVDGDWLAAQGYRGSPKPHGARYALFELGGAVSEREAFGSSADVFVCSARWTGRIDAAFFEGPLPECGSRSIPNVFERLRPFFGAWRSARAYNPVQMDFLALLNGDVEIDVPFPSPRQGKFTFIDLFAGIGGIRLGFQLNGGRCVFSSEWDQAAAKTYYCNFGERPVGDIQKVDPNDIPDFDVLLAGFPCQPFSIIGDKEGFNHETQGTLFFNIERILLAKRPKAFMLENVRNLTAHDGGRTFQVILAHLRKAGYDVHYKVLNALDYGVPQKRERIIICGFRRKVDFEFPPPIPPKERKTVADILDPAAEKDRSLFVRSEIRERRLSRLKDKSFPRPYISHENVAGSVTPHTFSCALRAGASANYILINDERRPSAREMLRIQGFPDEFKIVVNYGQIKHQTGNSVAVPVIRAVAERVVEKLGEI